MAKLRAIPGRKEKRKTLSLVYGLRLYRQGEVAGVNEGKVALRDGTDSHPTLHLIEGTPEQIRAQLLASIDAFFDIYGDNPEVRRPSSLQRVSKEGEGDETGC
jgi:hypothetical protein